MEVEAKVKSEGIVQNFIVEDVEMMEALSSLQFKEESEMASIKMEYIKPSIKIEEIHSSLIKTEEIQSTGKDTEMDELISVTSAEEMFCTVCPYTSTSILDFKKHMRSHTSEVFYDCHLCTDSFESKSTLNMHIRHHKKSNKRPRRSYTCDICSAVLTTPHAFKNHQMIHTGEKPHECPNCKMRFRFQTSLSRHLWLHDDPNQRKEAKYKCTTCSKTYPSSAQLKQHEISHTGEKEYHCPTCNKTFINSAALKKHVKIHTGEKIERNHPCPHCSKSFPDTWKLAKHIRTHMNDRPYNCDPCELTFKEKYHLDRHQKTHTGEKPYSCHLCGKTFRDRSNLKKHLESTHIKDDDGNYYTNKKAGPVMTCKVCRKVLSNELKLQIHMKRHTGGDGSHKCNICNAYFVTKFRFDKHMQDGLHQTSKGKNRIRRFNCEHCPAAFKDIRVLERHTRLHTGERPFACPTCGRKFISKFGIDRHMTTTHLNKNAENVNVKCHICSKTFKNYAKLKIHMDQHEVSDEKGFKCGLCNIFLRTLISFEKHLDQHEKYSCKICKLDFANQTEFDLHLETHSVIKPTCDHCGSICDSHKDLSVHFLKIHNLPRVNVVKLEVRVRKHE